MITIIKNIITFLVIFFIIGEITVRLKNAVSDIPQRQIDESGIQKYYPNQQGFWRGGTHAWHVNELGWPGYLPKNYDNLISIIGDSFIENFMNPNDCHQSVFLKEKLKNFNFIEAGRSGVSFIEAMEISKQLSKYKPITNLIYVNDKDFYQSIVEIEKANDITQFSLDSKSVVNGEMKSPGLKKVLYNWKFVYFLYNKLSVIDLGLLDDDVNQKKIITDNSKINIEKVFQLLDYIELNYRIDAFTLVFHPHSNKEIIKKCEDIGFNIIILNDDIDDQSWSFEDDHHWTCYGHEKAAEQVSKSLLKNNFNTK